MGSRQREQTALGVMLATARAFRAGRPQPSPGQVAESAGLPTLVVLPVLNRLIAAKLLNRTSKDQLYPQRDPATIKLIDIINAVRDPQVIDIFTLGRWPEVIRGVGNGMDRALEDELGDRSIYDLLDNDVIEPAEPIGESEDVEQD